MIVLFNGEYLDKDMSYVGGFEKIQQNQKDQYRRYADIIVGDFKILQVEYDWGNNSIYAKKERGKYEQHKL